MSATLALSAPAEAASVPLLRTQVVQFLSCVGLSPSRAQDVRLALSEALSNAVLHAYRDGAAGDLTVTAERRDGAIDVVVRDTGCGLTPRDDSPGLGLGLPVMRQTTDGLEFGASGAGGTEVRLHFDC